jgi:hypothetical protein
MSETTLPHINRVKASSVTITTTEPEPNDSGEGGPAWRDLSPKGSSNGWLAMPLNADYEFSISR